MIRPEDLGLIGLKPAPRRRHPKAFVNAFAAARVVADDPWMTYAVVREAGDWRLEFHGAKAGRFAAFEAALDQARRLARECAALGRPAAVIFTDAHGRLVRERHTPRGAAFGGFLAPHEA